MRLKHVKGFHGVSGLREHSAGAIFFSIIAIGIEIVIGIYQSRRKYRDRLREKELCTIFLQVEYVLDTDSDIDFDADI
jgi:hypothetical protein